MKAGLPILGHTKADYRRAMRMYRARFQKAAPGRGYTPARYMMLYDALNSDTPATETKLQNWCTVLAMMDPQRQGKVCTYDPKTQKFSCRWMSVEETKHWRDETLQTLNLTTMQRWSMEHWLARQRIRRG